MAAQSQLLYVVRLDLQDPKSEDAYNDYYVSVVMPAALRRTGFIRGFRYRLERGPAYVGWEGPSQASLQVHIYDLEDSERAIEAALQPLEKLRELSSLGSRQRPPGVVVREVRAVYRRLYGEMNFPPLFYMTRINVISPEYEADFEKFYDTVEYPGALKRPGFVRGAHYKIERGPVYHGDWKGPARSYLYMNLYELDGERGMQSAMLPVDQIPHLREWRGPRPLPGTVNVVRAVYRKMS